MKPKVSLLVIITVIITAYIIFVGMRVCTESFVVADTQADDVDILKNKDVDLVKEYEKKTQAALINKDPNMADPISDANMPYSQNIYEKQIVEKNINEYEIITIYKQLLDRNPRSDELEKAILQFGSGELNAELLRTYLLNSTEYSLNVKLQSNTVNDDVEYRYAKEDLILIISRMYFDELKVEPPKRMLLPLKDVFLLLENDKYLFRALLVHTNYKIFEDEVLSSKLMKKENILETFEKYFVLNDLKMKANDIKRYDALNKVNTQTQPPAAVPVNTAFQGTSLAVANSGEIGAGSGATFGPNQPTLEELLARI
jgi:hypothetical protein